MRPTTRAQIAPCVRCQAATIHAWTQPPAAWEAITDPLPLGPAAELAALAAGRMTYDLVTQITTTQLVHRDQFRIIRRDWPVLAEHKCPGPIQWAAIPPPPLRIEEMELDDIPY